jgi:charged multivesicular body protein 6
MGNVFGHKKHDKQQQQPAAAPAPSSVVHVTEQDRALLQVKVQRDRLHRLQASLSGVIAREVEVARQLLREDKKPQALLALKRKRYQETLLARTEGQWANLSDLANSLEFARQSSAVFEAMKQGNALLEQLNAQTKLEDVEALMDDTREAVAYQQQVSQMLGAELTQNDHEDIEDTIKQWEAEQIAEEMPAVPAKPLQQLAEPVSVQQEQQQEQQQQQQQQEAADEPQAELEEPVAAAAAASSARPKTKAKEVIVV